MMDFLNSPATIWAVVGLLLIAGEVVAPGLILMFFGIAALLTSLLTAIGLTSSTSAQLLTFASAAVVSIFVLRRYAKEYFVGAQQAGSDRLDDEFVGKTVKVTRTVGPAGESGRVELKGADWTATADVEIPAGANARIVTRDGINLVIAPLS